MPPFASSADPPSPGPHGTPPDDDVRELLAAATSAGLTPLHRLGVAEARERTRAAAAAAGRGPRVAAVTDGAVDGPDGPVPIRRYRPTAAAPPGTVVYAHGGGWVLGGLEQSDALCRHLAVQSGHEVVSVDYRLAPEHPFPAALTDVDAVIAHESAHAAVALVGDSAGGNLVAAATLRARERAPGTVRLQVLVYPVVDPSMTTASYREHGREGLLVSAADMRWFWDQYLPDADARRDPEAAPSLARSLRDLPQTLVIVADHDVLRDESLAYADRLADAGVDVTVDRYDTMIHGFFPLVGRLPASRRAVESVAQAVAQALR